MLFWVRYNVDVDEALCEKSHRESCECGDYDASDDCKEVELVVFQDIAHHTDYGFESAFLGLDHHSSGRTFGGLFSFAHSVLLVHLLVEVAAALHLDIADLLVDLVVSEQIVVCVESVDRTVIQNDYPVCVLHTGYAL